MYLVKAEPSSHVFLHLGAVPACDVYSKHDSATAPVVVKYDQAHERTPPLQPMFQESHETISWGDRITSVLPPVAIQILSDKASVAPKAQHDPH